MHVYRRCVYVFTSTWWNYLILISSKRIWSCSCFEFIWTFKADLATWFIHVLPTVATVSFDNNHSPFIASCICYRVWFCTSYKQWLIWASFNLLHCCCYCCRLCLVPDSVLPIDMFLHQAPCSGISGKKTGVGYLRWICLLAFFSISSLRNVHSNLFYF